MTNIVIVGAGFGGLQTALGLEKKFRSDRNIALTLLDARDYHLFTPNLYEAATSEEELVSESQLSQSIALPLAKILRGKKIKFIKARLADFNPQSRTLNLGTKQLAYDYLILALGSKTDFFNIEGADKFALTLKNFPDALRIRNQVGFAIQSHRLDFAKPNVRVVVAGGGYTGVELAGELHGLLDFLAWENNYQREKIQVEVIEAAPKLVPGFDSRLSDDAYFRLRELGTEIKLSARISSVDQHFVYLLSGEKLAYDVLLWTTGVKACPMPCESQMELDKKGRLMVNEYFQAQNYHNVFALGDMACVLGQNGQPVPSSAQDAVDQARYLVNALPYLMQNQKPPKPYRNQPHGFIVSVGGKWAIMSYGRLYATGFLAYFINQLAHLRYYASIVGWWKAFWHVVFEVEMYSRND